MLTNFVRIDFENASMDFTYTITQFKDMDSYLDEVEGDFELSTQGEVDEGKAVKVTITPLPGYTEEMWGKWLEALPK